MFHRPGLVLALVLVDVPVVANLPTLADLHNILDATVEEVANTVALGQIVTWLVRLKHSAECVGARLIVTPPSDVETRSELEAPLVAVGEDVAETSSGLWNITTTASRPTDGLIRIANLVDPATSKGRGAPMRDPHFRDHR
jgi:hypothetical protein